MEERARMWSTGGIENRVKHCTLDSRGWNLDSGRCTLDLDVGLWTLDSERWTLDVGLWMLDATLWTLGSGHWALLLTSSE